MDQNPVSSLQVIDAQEETHSRPMAEDSSKCPLCSGGQVVHFMTAPDRFHWRREQYNLMRCSTCSYVWLAGPPKPEEMSVHYSEEYHRAIMAAGENSARSRWQRQRDVIARHKKGGAILDIGCSSGAFLGTMRGESWKLYGIEWEASTAEKAKAATGAEVFVGEALDAPFLAESFDVITGFDLLEHVYHPRQFLAKVLEWLKPGGIAYFGLPNIDSWEARMLGTYWYGLELPRHLSFFSPRSLRHALTSLGFQEISLFTPPTAYVEDSASYICSGVLQKIGISPLPMSKRGPRSIPFRAVRKALRLSLVVPYSQIASMAGAGPSMEAVFRKPASHADHATGVSGGKA
jgi:SAM-dependent methyltransferase